MPLSHDWSLRRATAGDLDALHALACIPAVYRYLADGAAPPRSVLELWVERSDADFRTCGFGLWLLEDEWSPGGCVRLEWRAQNRSAELTYVLDPRLWGLGLATRMSWTVMRHAFDGRHVDQIVAGADEPNTESLAVMRRLGMTFARFVRYPAGPGLEYVFRRGDPAPAPLPQAIPFRPGETSE